MSCPSPFVLNHGSICLLISRDSSTWSLPTLRSSVWSECHFLTCLAGPRRIYEIRDCRCKQRTQRRDRRRNLKHQVCAPSGTPCSAGRGREWQDDRPMVRSIHQEPVARPPAEVHRLPQLPSGPPIGISGNLFFLFHFAVDQASLPGCGPPSCDPVCLQASPRHLAASGLSIEIQYANHTTSAQHILSAPLISSRAHPNSPHLVSSSTRLPCARGHSSPSPATSRSHVSAENVHHIPCSLRSPLTRGPTTQPSRLCASRQVATVWPCSLSLASPVVLCPVLYFLLP